MRSNQNFVQTTFAPISVDEGKKFIQSKDGVPMAIALALAVLDVLAYGCDGHDAYLTVGLKRDRTAMLLTQTFGSEKVYHAGESFEALLKSVLESYRNDL